MIKTFLPVNINLVIVLLLLINTICYTQTFGQDNPENLPPVVADISEVIKIRGIYFQVQVSATDPEGGALTFSATGLPPGISINPSTGLIRGIVPVDNNAGTSTVYDVTVVVTDAAGNETTESFTWVALSSFFEGSVVNFTLINADTDEEIRELDFFDTINLATLPTKNINIRANTVPAEVGSVLFEIDGYSNLENYYPYAAYDDLNGDYDAWTPAAGSYLIAATPFQYKEMSGTEGSSNAMVLYVIDEEIASSTISSNEMFDKWDGKYSYNAFPNPFSEKTSISFLTKDNLNLKIDLYDIRGVHIKDLGSYNVSKNTQFNYELKGEGLTEGIYFCKMESSKGTKIFKLNLKR